MTKDDFDTYAQVAAAGLGLSPERTRNLVAYAGQLARLVSQHKRERDSWHADLKRERDARFAAEARLQRVHEAVLKRIDPDFTFDDYERSE